MLRRRLFGLNLLAAPVVSLFYPISYAAAQTMPSENAQPIQREQAVVKGRIPVTLDDTEQTADIWMNNYGAGGGSDPITGTVSPTALMIDDAVPPQRKQRRDNSRFGNNQSYLAASKTDISDGLAASSYRSKGNYFAGKHGASGYLNNPVYDLNKCYEAGVNEAACKSSAIFMPNNNWHLPDKHPNVTNIDPM
ncbi:putative TonB-dependent receptor [Neisseria zoodegmatis]|uniref:Putative TonB-dependent receptor n=1 Tax=Neisseria zoodegmatis TaxID=326523 RepID=A0A378WTC8_9NEIS|nr:hypothetical protein [Neisseria zoodegmatis]SUA44498.1 putative TonB-dependent receptor [Neisseria zoodegmatis]